MLTGAGRNLLDGARALLRDARELETAVTASSPILPLLRLGLAESVSCTVGADIVGALFPCTKQLSVRTAMALQLSEQFKNGDFDLLISPVSFPDMDGVTEEAVVAESFFLVTPASNTKTVSTPADLLQLARDLPYFSYTTAASDKLISERILRSAGISPQRSVLVESSTTMMGLVAQGLGWALLLPSNIWMGRDFCDDLRFTQLPFVSAQRRQYAAIRSRGFCRAAKQAVEALQNGLRKRVIPQLADIHPMLAEGMTIV
jgi:DNA-binding transcriptional LysR family regulator